MAKRRTAIYDPPKQGFPYVVVFMDRDKAVTMTTATRGQARELVADERRADRKATPVSTKSDKKE
jgi:hypothetical protein